MEDNTLVNRVFQQRSMPRLRRSIFLPGALRCPRRNTSRVRRLTVRRCNYGAGRPAHVDQRRGPRRKPDRAALRRGGCRTDHLRLVSTSDVFTPTGRTKIGVIWDLSVKKIDDKTCEFTNTVQTCATPELLDFLGKQGIPLEVFRSARKPISVAHNQQETPMFAKSIERHALRQG